MDSKYDPKLFEKEIYQMWEKGGYFQPRQPRKARPFEADLKTYSILLPLPNANDPLHMGHALFTIQDILIRYHRMLGDATLWLPGGDHAGIETQYVFEKHLAKMGKSRFDFDRETLYRLIMEFVEKNKDINRNQMKQLGFSLDWSRYHYSLEPKILEIVFDTFRKLHQDGLIYRANKIVNFCTFCGTAFSDLEVNYVEKDESLYYLDYGAIQIATTRPETIFADVAVAVNPVDKRYKKLIGKEATIPLINKKVSIIADQSVDMKFGTGALKVTPAHDKLDFEIGQRHKLPTMSCIDISGRMKNVPKELEHLWVRQAKKKTIELLQKERKILQIKPLHHSIAICYRCKNAIEPLPVPQWYVKTKPLAKLAMDAVKKGQTKIEPLPRFEKMYFDWLERITDWNISRQIVWGPRIPAWYCLDCNSNIVINFLTKDKKLVAGKYATLKLTYSLDEILDGLQSIRAPVDVVYTLNNKECEKCHSHNLIQETDTFDTWFLSAQWPFTTLLSQSENSKFEIRNSKLQDKNKNSDFNIFYPTSVLDTMWDILFFWVARMMMLGIYRTGKAPFKVIHLHCRVVDKHGRKMSKSRGNVVNPIEMVEKYGADALRMALVFGAAPGSDIAISDDKVRAMRNFANKLWNMGRFIFLQQNVVVQPRLQSASWRKHCGQVAGRKNNKVDQPACRQGRGRPLQKENQEILNKLNDLIKSVTENIEKYRFDLAADELYHFIWHEFADKYIEWLKKNPSKESFAICHLPFVIVLKLLHPFMPFVTEALWQQMPGKSDQPLIISQWPKILTSESRLAVGQV